MPEQQKSDDAKEPLKSEEQKSETAQEGRKESPELKADDDKNRLLPVPLKSDSTELASPMQLKDADSKLPSHQTEWIPGEQLALVRIPEPTIWPATLALGMTGIAFGVVTHWILSLAGLFLFLLGAAGWIEDLRNDVY